MPGAPYNRSEALERLGPKLHRYLHETAKAEHLPVIVGSWFEGVGTEGLRRLSLAHLAAKPETLEALEAAERLLWRLPSTIRSRQLVLHGEVRGAVDWQKTAAERLHEGDNTLFVCRGIERKRDTPLARLIKLVVRRCAEVDRSVKGFKPIELQTSIADKARELKKRTEFRTRLGGTTGVSRIGKRTMQAIACRGDDERVLVEWLLLYERAIELREPAAVEQLLRDQLLAPAEDERLYELEVGCDLVAALEERGFTPEFQILDGSVPFAQLRRSGQSVTLWWQKAAIAKKAGVIVKGRTGLYATILAAAGLGESPLRPDFVIESDSPRQVLFVEVKNYKNDGDQGARNGVSEMLSYLADAETALDTLPEPHGLVVSWGTRAEPEDSQRVLVTHQDGIDEAIGFWDDA